MAEDKPQLSELKPFSRPRANTMPVTAHEVTAARQKSGELSPMAEHTSRPRANTLPPMQHAAPNFPSIPEAKEETTRDATKPFIGYTGEGHTFQTPVKIGRFSVNVRGNVSPDVAEHFGLIAHSPKAEAESSRGSQNSSIGYVDDAHTFQTPVKIGSHSLNVRGKVSPEVAEHYGLIPRSPKTEAESSRGPQKPFIGYVDDEHTFQTPVNIGNHSFNVRGKVSPEVARHYGLIGKNEQHETSSESIGTQSESQGKKPQWKLSMTPHIGGLFGEIVTSKLAQRAMKQEGINPANQHEVGSGSHNVGDKPQGKKPQWKPSMTPHIGGLFGEIATAKLAQHAMKREGISPANQHESGGSGHATGAKSQATKPKWKLSMTPHIGGLFGEKVTAKLAQRAMKQANETKSGGGSSGGGKG